MAKILKIINNNCEIDISSLKTDKPLKIISIIGNARQGKSTLINAYLATHNIYPQFKINDALEHCTTGIDAIKVEFDDYDLVFLDCQGINMGDSQCDYKLLSFTYIVSNIIIYNNPKILDNNVLKSLEQLSYCITFLNSNCEKQLIFRITDFGLKTDNPYKMVDNLLKPCDDHVKTIRESIKMLFSNISIATTKYPHDPYDECLNCYDYTKFNESKLFDSIYQLINQSIKNTTCITYNELESKILSCNFSLDNKDIDLLYLITYKQINEYLHTFNIEQLICDGYEESRIKIEKYKEKVQNFALEFRAKFAASNPLLTDEKIGEFETIECNKIINAFDQNYNNGKLIFDTNFMSKLYTWAPLYMLLEKYDDMGIKNFLIKNVDELNDYLKSFYTNTLNIDKTVYNNILSNIEIIIYTNQDKIKELITLYAEVVNRFNEILKSKHYINYSEIECKLSYSSQDLDTLFNNILFDCPYLHLEKLYKYIIIHIKNNIITFEVKDFDNTLCKYIFNKYTYRLKHRNYILHTYSHNTDFKQLHIEPKNIQFMEYKTLQSFDKSTNTEIVKMTDKNTNTEIIKIDMCTNTEIVKIVKKDDIIDMDIEEDLEKYTKIKIDEFEPFTCLNLTIDECFKTIDGIYNTHLQKNPNAYNKHNINCKYYSFNNINIHNHTIYDTLNGDISNIYGCQSVIYDINLFTEIYLTSINRTFNLDLLIEIFKNKQLPAYSIILNTNKIIINPSIKTLFKVFNKIIAIYFNKTNSNNKEDQKKQLLYQLTRYNTIYISNAYIHYIVKSNFTTYDALTSHDNTSINNLYYLLLFRSLLNYE